MKRKFFSTLLMGAFFIASMSMFTSCKDYDDDINSNKDAITALQKQLTTLQAALDQAKADATAAHATFLTKTEAASTYATQATVSDAVKALQTEMAKLATADQLQSAIDDLKTLIGGKASTEDLQALSTKVDGINTSLNTLTEDVKGLKSAQDDLTLAIKAANDNIDAQQKALDAFKTAVSTTYATNEALKNYVTTSDYTAKIKDLEDQISTLKASAGDAKSIEELKGDMQKLSDKVDKLSANINVLTFLVNSKLTSLVLKPEYYWQGIEAVEYPFIAGYPKQVMTLDNDKNEVWSASTNADDEVFIANYGIASYHVNPTSAQLKGYNVDFYGNVAETRSGANIAAPLQKTIDDKFLTENYSDGILSVPFQVSGFENFNKSTANKAKRNFTSTYGESLPMIALQLSKSNTDTQKADSVITSDYALVNITEYTDLTIADNIWKGTGFDCTDQYRYTSGKNSLSEDLAVSGHLHKTFKDLKPDFIPATHEVLFSGSIDLKQYMNVHFSYHTEIAGDWSASYAHKTMSDEVFKALGLKYKFTPVDYTLGTNSTSESQHIKIDANTGIATPVQVDNNGKRTDVQANQASVGRLPIIRVELQDANNNTLAVGYIKLKIVEKESVQTIIDQTLDGTAYVDCNGGGAATMTWAAFENNVYGKLGLSRKSFEKAYSFDADSWSWTTSTAVANQYFEANEASKCGNDQDHPIIGKVKYVQDWGSAHTAVLQWSFDENDLKTLSDLKLIKDGKTTADLTTYVRFTGASNVYIKLTIPAGSVRYVSGTISNKNLSYWYNLNSNTGASTNADAIDVRINVPTPGTATATPLTSGDFKKDLTDFFTNNTVKVEGVSATNFKNFVANASTDFAFTTPSTAKGNAAFDANEDGQWTVYGDSWYNDNGTWKHNEYTLKVNNNEDAIIAVEKNGASIPSTKIATLSGTNNRVITYMHNDVADDVLNYASHKSLGSKETFSAYIKVTYNSCYDADLQNSNYFNARFLRPVNLNPTKDQKIVDAPNGGADVDVAKLYGLTDWRDYALVDAYDDSHAFTGKFVVKSYYGISVDPSGTCYTDIALGAGKRTILDYNNINGIRNLAKTTDISGLVFTLVSATATKGAYFHYDNNEANVEEFHIYVPLTVTYTWGTKVQAGYAVVTVQKTIAQAKKN
jgi:predicted  nucleic acid-binding Zn-ribbon protein